MNINGKPVRTIEWLFIVIFLIFLATSFLEIPPASIFIKLYCKLFDTNRYPLLLMALIPTVIIITGFVLLQKILKKKQQ